MHNYNYRLFLTDFPALFKYKMNFRIAEKVLLGYLNIIVSIDIKSIVWENFKLLGAAVRPACQHFHRVYTTAAAAAVVFVQRGIPIAVADTDR